MVKEKDETLRDYIERFILEKGPRTKTMFKERLGLKEPYKKKYFVYILSRRK
jgi:hypothetical protein